MHKHKKIIKTHKKQGVGISNCQKWFMIHTKWVLSLITK
jgi:hypothetical protein